MLSLKIKTVFAYEKNITDFHIKFLLTIAVFSWSQIYFHYISGPSKLFILYLKHNLAYKNVLFSLDVKERLDCHDIPDTVVIDFYTISM